MRADCRGVARASVCREGRSEPWKIAVLVRSRNVLGDIVAELKDETKGAIPFRAVDIEPLGSGRRCWTCLH